MHSPYVLVTGAAGFIGSHLVEELSRLNYRVLALDCFLPDLYPIDEKVQNWNRLKKLPNVDLLELNLLDIKNETEFMGLTHVLHAAAMPGLLKSWSHFNSYSSNNINATQKLLEVSTKIPNLEKFLYISTSSVYGNIKNGAENHPLNPISPYGVSKLAGEKLVRAYSETFGLPFTILRYFSVFGPRQRPDMAYRIFAESIVSRKQITIFGDGTRSRSNTYISDCVQGTLGALFSPINGKVYNICGGESIEVIAALKLLELNLNTSADIIFESPRIGDQSETSGDFTLANRDFGYSPRVSVEDGLAKLAEWVKSRPR